MRVLIVVTPVSSRLLSLIPLAWALVGAGHDVLCAGEPATVEAARTAGLPTVDVALAPAVPSEALVRRPAAALPATALGEPDWEALAARWQVRVGRVIDGYLRFAREWRPDLVLSDPAEFCGAIVAGVLGVPCAVYRWGTDVLTTLARVPARAALRSLCERVGAPDGLLPDPDLLLDPCPPALRHPRAAPARPVRFVPYSGPGPFPAWAHDAPPGRRTVCVAFGAGAVERAGVGTLAATARALGALEGVRGVIVVAAAHARELGRVPRNVRLVRPGPLSLALGGCATLVHHGGAGTGLSALAFGLPQLVLAPPLPGLGVYAERISSCGAGRSLDPEGQRDPRAIEDALRTLLDDPSYAAAARLAREEMAAMPLPVHVVPELEELAASRPGAGPGGPPDRRAAPAGRGP
ncbi:DUF1205 domain-containing protein, partial [Streptomyces sp. B1866]|uniref:nucleotide disphospho-sugar-binding domain-containing protein n=1 Tax=Streptomyces sp. B1866 TaxID=3075431 RepID=UPI0028912BC3